MIKLQEIDFPADCRIIKHQFHTYDPVNAFSEEESFEYLHENLLQCSFPIDNIIVDLGWYGELTSSKGEFRIYVIQNENWDFPSNVIYSKSPEETKDLLTKILLYYTRTEVETELDLD